MAYNIAPSKQDLLVSGTNIKTVNGSSLLGSGDLAISGANTALSNLVAPTAINVQLRNINGSQASPSYSFTNATSTGLYTNGTSLFIVAGGNQMFEMNAGDIYCSRNFRFDGSVFGMNGKAVAIGDWTFGSSGQFTPSVDAETYAQRYRSIGRIGDSQNLQRPHRVDVARKLTVGKKFSTFSMYGATLAATQTDDITTAFTTTANASTTIITNSGDGIQSLIDIGDYIQLNGLSTTARVTNFTFSYPNATLTVDTALGDGASRAIIVKQSVASFRTNDGVEHVEIDRSGVLNVRNILSIQKTSAATSTVTNILKVDSQSSGTPANGIGVGIEMSAETASGNTEIGVVLEAVTTDVTSTSEDFDFVVKTMAAGATAAERMRVKSDGSVNASEFRVTNYRLDPHIHDEGTEPGNFTINWANSPVQLVELNGSTNAVVTLSNPVTGGAYAIKIVQGATPGTIDFTAGSFANVKWPGGTPPTLSGTTGDIDLINLLYIGTTYYGTFALDFA